MAETNPQDDAAARKARADAIRRARDRHNAGLPPEPEAPAESDATTEAGHEPNYVDLIDRRTRGLDEK